MWHRRAWLALSLRVVPDEAKKDRTSTEVSVSVRGEEMQNGKGYPGHLPTRSTTMVCDCACVRNEACVDDILSHGYNFSGVVYHAYCTGPRWRGWDDLAV